jgi:hypothetical protein
MAKNKVIFNGQTIIDLSTDTVSSAADIVSGKVGHLRDGTVVTGTGGGGSSNFTLLGTKSLGTISTSSTSAVDTGQTIVLANTTGWNDYDLLVCECSVDTKTNNRHVETTRVAWLTSSNSITEKNGCSIVNATHNTKLSSSGVVTARSSTTANGVYVNVGQINTQTGTLTFTIYQRYNSTQTGTINGKYTMRIYGCKIYDLVGG